MNLNKTETLLLSHKLIHFYNIFTHNFQIIYTKLNEIETALSFAKIKLLHQSIIDTDELVYILKEIEITNKLVYPVNLENIVKIEQSIELKAYVKQNQIKFIMHIPLINNETYNYYKLIPLPVHSDVDNLTSVILPKYPYILVKGLKISMLTQPCAELDEARFLCPETESTPLLQDKCIIDLFHFSTNISTCLSLPVSIGDLKIEFLQLDRWLVYARTEIIMSKFCNNEVNHEKILGTYLITIDNNCYIKIQDHTLRRKQSRGKDIVSTNIPIVNLPHIRKAASAGVRKPLNLKEINLTDIQLLNLLMKKGEVMSERTISENSENSESSVLVFKVLSRDFYVGMFKRNDILVAQDRLYKEKVPFRKIYAKYGRLFKCPITYFRVVDRLGVGRGPKVEIIRGGLQHKYLVLRLTSLYSYPISVNVYVGCANKIPPRTAISTKSPDITTESKGMDKTTVVIDGHVDSGNSTDTNKTMDATTAAT
ncbi:uncharacterized protein LOC123697552 [Colias croceus]|uniref:uncharacterized protein LOC123697552 n=1 Tax=Colias crocea TaxID=72248 RepID=UPI001E27E30E|nr:uncharacterized protein LOC123697552 [Colias croceus]